MAKVGRRLRLVDLLDRSDGVAVALQPRGRRRVRLDRGRRRARLHRHGRSRLTTFSRRLRHNASQLLFQSLERLVRPNK